MKFLIFIYLVILGIACSCSGTTPDSVENFIPGTYIRFTKHEFGTEYDTLVISMQNRSVKEYKIIRRWKYERVLDGVKTEPEYKRMATAAVYSTQNKFLRETGTGDIYSFDVKEKVLFNGPAKYKKL